MPISVPTPGDVLTVATLGAIVTFITEVILRAWAPPAATKDRFGPLLALIVGVAFASAAAIVTGQDLFAGVLVGLVAGGMGMGIHDTVDSVTS
jgi:hypothetical protein